VILSRTDPRWLAVALGDLGSLLVDHAHCERKAAAAALSLVSRYCQRPDLVRALSALAIEELAHFRAVVARVRARGLVLTPDRGDPYARALHQQQRTREPEQQIDRLLTAGLIEARSHERLLMLAAALPEPEGLLYRRLARAEHGHAELFLRLARGAVPAHGSREVELRLHELAAAEARIVEQLPLLPRIH
jgi:tRNA-(ms[2]io[6]A)-hydroxylase